MRRPFIAGNWKMYRTISEAIQLVSDIKRELIDFTQADIAVCPPFTALSNVGEMLIDTPIKLGAQNLYWEKEGAFTGEVSASMLRDCGCFYVIIGHSERRKYSGETDASVNKKIKAAVAGKLSPIVCVGETSKEREQEKTIEVIRAQLRGAFDGVDDREAKDVVIAYEPVWAIGTGKTATPAQAEEVHKFIRAWMDEKISPEFAGALRILYGGSVKPDNIQELMQEEDIDGALVGGASLNAGSFAAIVKNSISHV